MILSRRFIVGFTPSWFTASFLQKSSSIFNLYHVLLSVWQNLNEPDGPAMAEWAPSVIAGLAWVKQSLDWDPWLSPMGDHVPTGQEAFLVVTMRAGNATTSWVQDRYTAKPLQCTRQPPQRTVWFQRPIMSTCSKSKHCLTHLWDNYGIIVSWGQVCFQGHLWICLEICLVVIPQREVGDGINRVETKDEDTYPLVDRTAPNSNVICSIMSLLLKLRDLTLEYRGCSLVPIKLLPDSNFEDEQGAQNLNSVDRNELLDMSPRMGPSNSVCDLSTWTYYLIFLPL